MRRILITPRFALLVLLVSAPFTVRTQPKPDRSQEVLTANRLADEGVMAKDIPSLQKIYADDFVFTHGTGLVDGKESWLKTVASPEGTWTQRKQDSTAVEMHGDVAIVTGSVSIVREVGQTRSSYGIRYVRVFVYRQKRWQMISHRTTREWRE
jgi:ketosteroid isomerase-like protein